MMITDGDNCWPDLKDKMDKVVHLANGAPPLQVALLNKGMASGRPSVMLRIDLPDGRVVLAETSLLLFATAARAFASNYPDLFAGD
jgi:hypothetical protein